MDEDKPYVVCAADHTELESFNTYKEAADYKMNLPPWAYVKWFSGSDWEYFVNQEMETDI